MKILITAGPTREFIDPVRFISNPATGRLGYILAAKAASKGHSVTLISGPTYLKSPSGVNIITVQSAGDMLDAVVKHFSSCDVLVMNAAVCDWKPERTYTEKLKKQSVRTIKLIPNPDILKAVAGMKKENRIVVGFALESSRLLENGLKKLKEKNTDMIVVNDVSYFGEGNRKSSIFILSPDKRIENCSGFSKTRLAAIILKRIEEKWKEKKEPVLQGSPQPGRIRPQTA